MWQQMEKRRDIRRSPPGIFFDNYGFVLVNGPLESADIILTEQRKQRFLER